MDRRERIKIAEHLKDARVCYSQHGKQSMDAVAKAIGVSKSIIQNLEDENNDREPSYVVIRKLALHYNVSADYLLGLSDDRHRKHIAVDELGLPQEAVDQIKEVRSWADREEDPAAYFHRRFELLCTLLSDKRFEDFLNYFANIYWAAEETRTERKKKEAREIHGAASAKHGYQFEKYLCLERFGRLLVSVCGTEDLED